MLHFKNECADIALQTTSNDVSDILKLREKEELELIEKRKKSKAALLRWANSVNLIRTRNLTSKVLTITSADISFTFLLRFTIVDESSTGN